MEAGDRVTVMGDTTEWPVADEVSPRDAFAAFVMHRSAALLRTAYLLTHDRQLAEDLLQTALAKAWPRWKRIDESHEAYVRQILINTYATWWRRKWRAESPTGEPPEVSSEDVDPSAAEDVRRALARLPRRQRAVVVLRFFEDLSEAETARLMSCSIGTVKSQTSKALAKLRIDPTLADQTDHAGVEQA